MPGWLVGVLGGTGAVALFAIAWWTSGRSKRAAIEPHRRLIQTDAYARSEETQLRHDPGGPFG